MSEYLMGCWDCPGGHKGQRGDAEKCAKCGEPRPEDVEFYLPENAEHITDAAGIAAAEAGADKICDSCGTSRPANAESCPGCGASLDGAKRQEVIDYAEGAAPRSGDHEDAPLPVHPPRYHSSAPTPDPGRSAVAKGVITMAGIALVALLGGLGWWLLTPHPTQLTVADMSWERTIALEEQRTVPEEDWAVPAGGRETGTYQAVRSHGSRKIGEKQVVCHPAGHREQTGTRPEPCHSSDRVKTGTHSYACHPGGHREQTGTETYNCGTTSLGNGRFRQNKCTRPTYSTRSCSHRCSEDVYSNVRCTHDCPKPVYTTFACKHSCTEDINESYPIYDTKHKYMIERWFTLDPVRTHGTGNEPVWAEPDTTAKMVREAGRREHLFVIFRDKKGRSYPVENPDSTYWASLRPGMHCTVMLGPSGFTAPPVCK